MAECGVEDRIDRERSELADDDRHFVATGDRTADLERCELRQVHRDDRRRAADREPENDPASDHHRKAGCKDNQQHTEEEHHGKDENRLPSTDRVRDPATEERPDRRGEHQRADHNARLQQRQPEFFRHRALGATRYARVVAEQQPAETGNDRDETDTLTVRAWSQGRKLGLSSRSAVRAHEWTSSRGLVIIDLSFLVFAGAAWSAYSSGSLLCRPARSLGLTRATQRVCCRSVPAPRVATASAVAVAPLVCVDRSTRRSPGISGGLSQRRWVTKFHPFSVSVAHLAEHRQRGSMHGFDDDWAFNAVYSISCNGHFVQLVLFGGVSQTLVISSASSGGRPRASTASLKVRRIFRHLLWPPTVSAHHLQPGASHDPRPLAGPHRDD